MPVKPHAISGLKLRDSLSQLFSLRLWFISEEKTVLSDQLFELGLHGDIKK